MRMTLRSWTWEYGMLLLIPAAVVTGLQAVFGDGGYVGGAFGTSAFWYAVYYLRVVRKYPTRGDLPEWQEWIAGREAGRMVSRES
jgi:hypothetical protein